jgi:hypothetical protein
MVGTLPEICGQYSYTGRKKSLLNPAGKRAGEAHL